MKLNSFKTTKKPIPACRFLKSQEKKIRKPNVSRLLPNICDFQTENRTLGRGFKIL
jgi:hypothetical protein